MYLKWGMRFAIAAIIFAAILSCRTADVFIAQVTLTPTKTPRPTYTPLPPPTDTPAPTDTATPEPTATATRKPTARPPTPRPPTPRPQPTAPPAPPVSQFEFHVNPPTCAHSGQTYIKGTVYLDKNDPSNVYVGAIVALGPPDGSTIYDTVKSDQYGQYTFTLGLPGQAHPGTWGVWLVDPSHNRKSDIGGPIVTNDLPADNPSSCWAGSVDFWK
jgi:hypothetical protein